MKTRTLLVLSVVTALAILVAGGVLLLQLSNESVLAAAESWVARDSDTGFLGKPRPTLARLVALHA